MTTPRQIVMCRLLTLLATWAIWASLGAAEAAKDEPAPVRYAPANSQLVIYAQDPSQELQLAAASVGLPVTWKKSARPDLTVAVIGSGSIWNPSEMLGSQNLEGYQAIRQTKDLNIVARSQRGAANGLYDLRRALLAAEDRDEIEVTQLISPGVSNPAFAQRATYTFLAPWNLPNLNGAALTLDQWKAHLERMRRLNVNQFYFDLWSDQFYHPDHSETLANKALYERMRQVCDYAHRLGLRTGMFVFPCQVPVSTFLAHPEARPVEAVNYHGIHLCPSKAWDLTNAFNTYAIEYFGAALDDVVVEMQDPGSCLCADCCRQFPELVLRFVEAYRKIPGGPAGRRVDLCSLHFRDWLETPEIDSRVAAPIKELRRRVFEHLPAGTLLFDSDRATLELARQHKLRPVFFFFELDPESGIENQQVFPHVNLRRLVTQIDSQQRLVEGILDYRMMPLAQYVADYVLFRKLWDPRLAAHPALESLAAELGISPAGRPRFARAMRDLDAWDQDHDLDALKQASQLLAELAAGDGRDRLLVDWRDLVAVEAVIGEFWSAHQESIARPDFYPPPELVEQVYRLMLDRPIFAAYTAYQHWELRSREIIGQRLRWWLQALGPAKKS